MTSTKFRLGLATIACLIFTSGCGTAPTAPTPPPKLVVLVVIDGLPMRQVTGYRDQLSPDGFRRFLDRGTWFANAHYGHGHTVTAAGHAVMLTGAYPQRTGIISNEWRDPNTGAPVYCTGDEAHQYLENKTAPLAGTSPKNLRAESVGDVLRGVQPGSRVVGISGKDRGAILPAGKLGTAYMYMSESGQFASSSYYMKAHPQWVKTFNAAKPADAYFKQSWTPLLPGYDCPEADASRLPPPAGVKQAGGGPAPACAYARSVPDGKEWQVNSGNGNKLPALIGDKNEKPGPLFYGNLLATPFADALTLAFARAAIEGEALGQDDVPDILSVSLSSHDYVNHAFGPESRLSHDHMLQLDLHLQAFFRYLDAKVGVGNYVAVLTADHGFADTPEWSASKGLDAGRLNPGQTLAWLNTGLSQKFGDGKWALGWSGGGILLDSKLIAAKKLNPAAVDKEAKTLLLQVDGIADVFTREQYLSQDVSTPFLVAMRKSWHPDIASSLQVVVKPNWLISSRIGGSSHGTPHAYDTHVPILSYGPRWVGQGQVNTRVEVADIAPTLAGLLRVRVPAQSEGKVLPLPLK